MIDSTQISDKAKEILEIFKKSHFEPLTLDFLSKKLNISENTLDQRLRRQKDEIFIWYGKPKKIEVKKRIKAVVIIKQNNQCAICRNKFPDSELSIYNSARHSDIFHYNSQIALCKTCSNRVNSKILTSPLDFTQISPYLGRKWEYKQVIIRLEYNFQTSPIIPNYYYSFMEITDVNIKWEEKKWQHLIYNLEEGKKASSMQDILNYFGIQGWECIKIQPIDLNDDSFLSEFVNSEDSYKVFLKREFISPNSK
ncbi:MAG: hypothetical protein ACTSVL_09925 [Promethearchaeota archaeon]